MVILDMVRWQCPAVLMLLVLVLLIIHNPKIKEDRLDFVELFAGRGEVSESFRRNGLRGSSHDLLTSGFMDICTTAGFLPLGYIGYSCYQHRLH